jgi:hypothetical protein
VIDEVLHAAYVAGEAAYAVVHHDDVGFKTLDEKIHRLQRRNLAAGGDVDIRPERADAGIRMCFRIGVNGDVAFIQMADDRLLFGAQFERVHRHRR